MSENVEIWSPHSDKQEKAIRSNKRILLTATGTQFGKTVIGSVRMMIKSIHQFTDPEDNFIITSPNYKTMQQSTLPAFKKFMREHGEYSAAHQVFKVNGGGTIYLRTETDPDSIVGITNVRHIWGDEAGKYRLYFWENIQARADYYGCSIDLTTSPYSINWVYKNLIKPTQRGLRNDVDLIQAASWENPYHSLADERARAAKRATMDERRFNMIYGGQWNHVEGLVYDCFNEAEHVMEPCYLPEGTRFYAGVDWGYNPDPFVVVVHAVTPSGKRYQLSEFYKTGLTPSMMVEVLRQKHATFKLRHAYCDPSQPGMIEELARAGIPALPADNDILRGVGAVYELIKTKQLIFFQGACRYTLDELESYHYPSEQDLKPDQNEKEPKPVDQNNHALDAIRYVSIMTHRSTQNKTPHVPSAEKKPETQSQRLERLKNRRRNKNTEAFS